METENISKEANQIEIPVGCTCNDEWRTTFCPIHPPDLNSKKPAEYGEVQPLIITDADMSQRGYGYWEGYIFKCPNCGVDAIMVNLTMGKSCTNCKRDIEVRSATITAKIRNLNK